MSVVGQTPKCEPVCVMSAFLLEADTSVFPGDGGFVPKAVILQLLRTRCRAANLAFAERGDRVGESERFGWQLQLRQKRHRARCVKHLV